MVEHQKFRYIFNCEKFLGLHRDDLIPPGTLKFPGPIRLMDMFRPSVQNTAVFIFRMHMVILAFAVVYVVARLIVNF